MHRPFSRAKILLFTKLQLSIASTFSIIEISKGHHYLGHYGNHEWNIIPSAASMVRDGKESNMVSQCKNSSRQKHTYEY